MLGSAQSRVKGPVRTSSHAPPDTVASDVFFVSSGTPQGFALHEGLTTEHIGASANDSTNDAASDVTSLDQRTPRFEKMLRLWHKWHGTTPQLVRISNGSQSGIPLAVKGGAVIHGLYLAARPVGSDWRTRHPHQRSIHTTREEGD